MTTTKIIAAKDAKESEETMAKVMPIKDKLSIMVKVLKKARTEEEAAGSTSVQEVIAQVVAKMEAIINVVVEAMSLVPSQPLPPVADLLFFSLSILYLGIAPLSLFLFFCRDFYVNEVSPTVKNFFKYRSFISFNMSCAWLCII